MSGAQFDLLAGQPKPEEIRGLSLTEPWAWCVRQKLKLVETRSWRTKYRGLVAIHAAQRLPTGEERRAAIELLEDLRAHHGANIAYLDQLPRGCIVAVARLKECQRTEDVRADLSERERLLGNYSPGRWAWILWDVRPCGLLIEAKGSLGLWRLTQQQVVRVKNSLEVFNSSRDLSLMASTVVA